MTDWKMYGQIQEHKRKGFNKSQITRLLGKDYKTILKYWDMTPDEFAAEKEYAGTRIKKAEPYEEYVVECLRKYPDMSAAQLYDWILEKRNGIELPFKERSFRSYVTNIREKYDIKKTVKSRQYEAVDDPPMGEQAQVDLGEIILETVTGKHKKVYCFGMVMSNSRQKFVYWLDKPFTTDSFIDAHFKAFDFFGGRTKEIVYDQDKILAVSENNGDIIYTEQFQAFISTVKFNIYLCRGSDPESKGRIEAVVKYAKYGFAEHRIFHDIETFNVDCLAWLNRTANKKIHETTKKIPAEVFALEQEYLIPVPYNVDTYNKFKDRAFNKKNKGISMRSHYAVGFYKDEGDSSKSSNRKESIRSSFNSPFRPFVLATTSIGQEGLDFHYYCRKVMHWNLPSNPIDLEQREGRINRFKCLAIRQNIALKYGDNVDFKKDVWEELFARAKEEYKDGYSELIPFWCLPDNQEIKIDRIIASYPLSKDIGNYQRLIKILSLYRLTLGQARQEELLEYIFTKCDDSKKLKDLFINLSPYYREIDQNCEVF